MGLRRTSAGSLVMVAVGLLVLMCVVDYSAAIETGGGDCTAEDCYMGTCVLGKCECHAGWTCDYCHVALGTSNTCPEYVPLPKGGATCNHDSQCGSAEASGKCEGGKCACKEDFTCPRCDARSGSTRNCPGDDRQIGGGRCVTSDDCGKFQGSCMNGQCECFGGWTCPWCTTRIASGNSCPPPPDLWAQGGGHCESSGDCGDWKGGHCQDNKCKCFSNWICPHCEVSFAERSQGKKCGWHLENAAARLTASDGIFGVLIAGLAIFAAFF